MFYLISLMAIPPAAAAVALDFCSPSNLGVAHSSNEFMLNGLCKTTCLGQGYAVGITQNTDCWCSNDLPEDTVSISDCNIGCPGFSNQEKCGGTDLYGYAVFGTVSATVGSSTSGTSTAASSNVQSLSAISSEQTSALGGGTSSSTSSSDTSSTGSITTSSMTSSTSIESSSKSAVASSTVDSSTYSSMSSSTSSTSSSGVSLSTTSSSSVTSTKSSSMSLSAESSHYDSDSHSKSHSSLKPHQSSKHTSSSQPALSHTKSQSITASPQVHTIAMTTIVSVTTDGTATSVTTTKFVTQTESLAAPQQKTFFESSGKVAGTFTAVGVVVVAALAGILYCCCFATDRHSDDYSDEENQYSLDDGSLGPKPMAQAYVSKTPLRLLSYALKRHSYRPFRAIFSPGEAGVGRTSSRKKFASLGTDNVVPMFPILELDLRLDPRTMFKEPKVSLSDEQDYLRRILHVTNPDG